MNAQTGTLKLVVTNIENNKGTINIALFDEANESKFLKDPKFAVQREIVKISNGQAGVLFYNIPFGTYAISVFHDENNNGKIERTFIGFPSEAIGISGNKLIFGHPDFEDCKFVLNSEEKRILIKLKSLF